MGWRTMTTMATVATLVVAGAAAEARADTLAADFQGGNNSTPGNLVVGWSFTVNSPVTVTALGVWDFQQNGLGASHDVAIWTTGGVLVLSGTVPSGTAGTLDSEFRFTSTLSGTTALAAGAYVIGAHYAAGSDGVEQLHTGVLTPPEITFTGSRFLSSATIAFPTLVLGGAFANDFAGPNFLFASAVVTPEPGTTALFGLGALGLAGVVVRRRRGAKRTR